MRGNGGLALEEPHLHAGQLHHIIVIQAPGLRSNGHAVDLRIVVFLAAVHVHDEVAFGAARNGRHLHTRTAESGECFGQLEFASRKGAAQDLQLRLRQGRCILRHTGALIARDRLGGLIYCNAHPPNAFLAL